MGIKGMYRWPFSIETLGNLTVKSPQTCTHVCTRINSMCVLTENSYFGYLCLKSRKSCVPGVGRKVSATAKHISSLSGE